MHKKIDDGFDGLVSDLQKTLSYQTEASGYDPDAAHPFGKHMTEALDAFLGMAKSHGFITRNIDNTARNIDTSDDESLALDALKSNMDLAPATERAICLLPPYDGVQKNGWIYER